MSTDTLAVKRGMHVYAITAVCVLAGLMQLAGGLMIFNTPFNEPPPLPGQQFMTSYVIFTWGVGTVVLFATGAAVYLMRTAAIVFMGYLLAHSLATLVGRPLLLVSVLNVPFYPVLTYFTLQMFERSPAVRSRHLHRLLLLGLAAGHVTVLLRYAYAYPSLTASGVFSPVLIVAALVGCAAFYTAVLTIGPRPERAKKLFLFAAVFTALQLRWWSYRWSLSAPFWLEVPVASYGFWLARRWSRQRRAPAPTPDP